MDAYISEDGQFVSLACDSTKGRYARASAINALRRKLESERGIQLELIHKSYSEAHGFLSRTTFRYRVSN